MNKHIYTMEHNSAIKTNELLLTTTASMKSHRYTEREKKQKSQSQNSTDCMIPLIHKNGMMAR